MSKNYYDILGVSKNATEDEIKKAFRKISKENHPDAQHGKTESEKKAAEERFKEASEAYDTLSNKDKRQKYDAIGEGGGSGGFNPFQDGFDPFASHFNMHSHFKSHFGFDPFGAESRPVYNPNAAENGRNVKISLSVSFKESLFGVVKEFDINIEDICEHCNGTGTADKQPIHVCSMCGGTGMFVQSKGMVTIQQTCSNCGGLGYMNTNPCPVCHGSKRHPKSKHISIKIPPGIADGNTLRVAGAGQCGINGGTPGDLYVEVHIPQSDIFKRSRNDLETLTYISPILASIGGKHDVYTPYGTATIKIPAGTKSGQVFRVAGKGVKASTGTGDLFVKVEIEPLVNLTTEQIKILKDFNNTITTKNLQKSEDLRKKLETLFK